MAFRLGLPRRIEQPDAVAITFDDGPHPEGTPAIMRALDRGGAPGVFFLCGEQVEREPGLAREIVAAGHTVGLHGYRHRNVLRLAPRTFVEDLERCIATIEDVVGLRPHLYRPPYGIFSYPAIAEIRVRDLRPLLWSRWGHDWRRHRSPDSLATEVSEGVRGGDVLLLHDSDRYSGRDCWRNTAAALPAVLGNLEAAGLRPTRV